MLRAFIKGLICLLFFPIWGVLFIFGFLLSTILLFGCRADGVDEYFNLTEKIVEWWKQV